MAELRLTPVDYDPFAETATDTTGSLTPVDYDPFADGDEAGLTFTESLGRGVDLAQGLSGGFVEAVGEGTGIEGLTQWGREVRERNMDEAEVSPRSMRVGDIGSFDEFSTWAKETIGEQIPLMAPSLAGSVAGGLAGAVTPVPGGAIIGATIGAFVPSFVFGVGEVQSSIKDKGGTNPGAAFIGGSAIAALDSVLPGKIGSAMVRKLGREAAETVAQRALMKRVAVEGAKGVATEGITEAIQEAVGEVAAAVGTDTEVDWVSLREQMLEAGAAGSLMGGAVSVTTAALPERSRPDDASQGERAKAAQAPIDITPEDEASPIPTDLIAEGKMALNDADATQKANAVLDRNGIPNVGQRVDISFPDGSIFTGTLEDASETDGDGFSIILDDGRTMNVPVSPDVTVTPEQSKEEAPEPIIPDTPVEAIQADPTPDVEPALNIEETVAPNLTPVNFDPFAENVQPEPAAAPEPVIQPEPVSFEPFPAEPIEQVAEPIAARDYVIPEQPAEVAAAPVVEKEILSAIHYSPDEIDALIGEQSGNDRQKLIRALGSEEAAIEFERLERRANSLTNIAAAAAASAEMNKITDDFTEEQERLVFGVGEKGLNVEDLKEVRRAFEDTNFDESDINVDVAQEVTQGARRLTADKIKKVLTGGGIGAEQADVLRMQRGLAELKARGLGSVQVDELLLTAMGQRGFSLGDATEILNSFGRKISTGKNTPSPTPQIKNAAPPTAEDAFNANPEQALNELSDDQLKDVAKAAKVIHAKDNRIRTIERIMAKAGIKNARAAYLSVLTKPVVPIVAKPPKPRKSPLGVPKSPEALVNALDRVDAVRNRETQPKEVVVEGKAKQEQFLIDLEAVEQKLNAQEGKPDEPYVLNLETARGRKTQYEISSVEDIAALRSNLSKRAGEHKFYSVTPAFGKVRDGFKGHAEKLFRKVAGDDVALEFRNEIIADQKGAEQSGGNAGPAAGVYDPVASIAALSLSYGDPVNAAAHEGWRVLRSTKFFTRGERKALSEGKTRFKEIATEQGLAPETMTDESLEAVAFAKFATDKAQVKWNIRHAFNRAKKFLDKLASWLKFKKISGDNVFEKALKGDIAKRPGTENTTLEPAFSVTSDDAKRFANDLDKFVRGELKSGRTLVLGKTPEVLKSVGAADLKLVMSQRVAKKISLDKHAIHTDTLVRLPELIADPIMVLDSASSPKDSRVVVLDANDGEGSPLIATVHIGNGEARVNAISSVYGKDSKTWFGKQIDAGRLRYINQKKSPGWFRYIGVQYPKWSASQGSSNSVLTEADFVNKSERYSVTAMTTERRDRLPWTKDRVIGSDAQEAAIQATMEVDVHVPLGERVRNLVTTAKQTLETAAVQRTLDQFESIRRYEVDVKGEIGPASVSAYKATRLTQNLHSAMAAVLRHGPLSYENGGFVVADGFDGGFEGIFEDLSERGLTHLWKGWAMANRAKRLKAEGRENNMTEAQIETLLGLERQYPEFRQVLEKYQGFNKAMLDMAETAGLINSEQRSIWESDDYVPFYRILDEHDQGPGKKGGISGQRSGIKTLSGGEAQVGDIIENMVLNMTHLVDASFKNIAAQRVVDMVEEGGMADGSVIEPAAMEWTTAHVPASEAANKLQEIGVDIDKLAADQKDHWLKLFTIRPPKDPDVISVMKEGKPEYYRVNDPLLLSALTSMRNEGPNALMTILRAPKRWLTIGITSFPGFMLRNFVRDSLHSWTVTGKDFLPFKDSASGFKKSLMEDSSLIGIMASGGGSGGYFRTNPSDVRQLMDAKLRGVSSGKILDSPKELWEMWRKIGQASENANRIAVYEAVLKETGDTAEAAYQAMDLLDFSMKGDSRLVRFLIETVPFLNARAQGLYRMGRGAKENPKSFMLRGGMITAATLGLVAMNWDDDRYDDIPEWEKDIYYHVFLDNIFPQAALEEAGINTEDWHIKIPKPFEVGAVFSTVPERFVRTLAGKDDGNTTAERTVAMFRDTFALDLPQFAKPLMEQAANRNFFRDRDIVSQRYERLSPEAQYDSYTSEAAKLLGDALPDFAGDAKSPKRIDALVKGYLGNIGTYVLMASDMMLEPGNTAPKPEMRLDRIPELGGFFRSHPAFSTKWTSDFYDSRREVQELVATIRHYKKNGNIEQAKSLVRENRDMLGARKMLENTGKMLTSIANRIRHIEQDGNLSSGAKRLKLDSLFKKRNTMTKKVMLAFRGMENKARK